MAKTPKQFRLSDETLECISWLKGDLELDATSVVTRAVRDLYDERRRARILEGDESWVLEVEGQAIACGTNAVRDQLAEAAPDLLERMGEGLLEETALGALVVAFSELKGDQEATVVISDDYIEEVMKKKSEGA